MYIIYNLMKMTTLEMNSVRRPKYIHYILEMIFLLRNEMRLERKEWLTYYFKTLFT